MRESSNSQQLRNSETLQWIERLEFFRSTEKKLYGQLRGKAIGLLLMVASCLFLIFILFSIQLLPSAMLMLPIVSLGLGMFLYITYAVMAAATKQLRDDLSAKLYLYQYELEYTPTQLLLIDKTTQQEVVHLNIEGTK